MEKTSDSPRSRVPSGGGPDWGSAIRIFRSLRGLSQDDLASAAGISPSHISLLEAGKRGEPSEKTLRRIAEALGTTQILMRLITCSRSEPWTIDDAVRHALARSFVDLLFPPAEAKRSGRP